MIMKKIINFFLILILLLPISTAVMFLPYENVSVYNVNSSNYWGSYFYSDYDLDSFVGEGFLSNNYFNKTTANSTGLIGKTCSSGQILEFNSGSGGWDCGTDGTGTDDQTLQEVLLQGNTATLNINTSGDIISSNGVINNNLTIGSDDSLEPYLSSDGVYDWVDLGISFNEVSKFEFKASWLGDTTYNTYKFFADTTSPNYEWIGIRGSTSKIYVGAGTSFVDVYDIDTEIHDYVYDYANGEVLIDNNNVYNFTTFTRSSDNIYLFTNTDSNGASNRIDSKMFYFKLYNDTGSLIMDLVPQNNGCFLDTISSNEFCNNGTGDLEYGATSFANINNYGNFENKGSSLFQSDVTINSTLNVELETNFNSNVTFQEEIIMPTDYVDSVVRIKPENYFAQEQLRILADWLRIGKSEYHTYIQLDNPGIGLNSVLEFAKTNDKARVTVTEVASDQTWYQFYMADNPQTTSDKFFWFMDSYRGWGADWRPLEFKGYDGFMNAETYFINGNMELTTDPYYSSEGVAGTYYKTGTGTLTLQSIDVSGYDGTEGQEVQIILVINETGTPNTYNLYKDRFADTQLVASNVSITGSSQHIGYGIYVDFSGTTGGVSGDRYYFNVWQGGALTNNGNYIGNGNITTNGDTYKICQGSSGCDDYSQYFDGTNQIFNTTGEYHFYNETGYGILHAHDFVTHTYNQSINPLEMFVENQTYYDLWTPEIDLSKPVEIINCTDRIVEETYEEVCDEIDETNCTYVYREGYTMQDCKTEITYPYKKLIKGQSQGKLLEDLKGMAIDLNGVMTIYSNLTDFDTGLMVENIFTQSKTIKDNTSYIDKIKDKDKLKFKETHYAYVDNIMGSGYSGLDLEERVVVLEGAVNELFTVLCSKNILKKEDGCIN